MPSHWTRSSREASAHSDVRSASKTSRQIDTPPESARAPRRVGAAPRFDRGFSHQDARRFLDVPAPAPATGRKKASSQTHRMREQLQHTTPALVQRTLDAAWKASWLDAAMRAMARRRLDPTQLHQAPSRRDTLLADVAHRPRSGGLLDARTENLDETLGRLFDDQLAALFADDAALAPSDRVRHRMGWVADETLRTKADQRRARLGAEVHHAAHELLRAAALRVRQAHIDALTQEIGSQAATLAAASANARDYTALRHEPNSHGIPAWYEPFEPTQPELELVAATKAHVVRQFDPRTAKPVHGIDPLTGEDQLQDPGHMSYGGRSVAREGTDIVVRQTTLDQVLSVVAETTALLPEARRAIGVDRIQALHQACSRYHDAFASASTKADRIREALSQARSDRHLHATFTALRASGNHLDGTALHAEAFACRDALAESGCVDPHRFDLEPLFEAWRDERDVARRSLAYYTENASNTAPDAVVGIVEIVEHSLDQGTRRKQRVTTALQASLDLHAWLQHAVAEPTTVHKLLGAEFPSGCDTLQVQQDLPLARHVAVVEVPLQLAITECQALANRLLLGGFGKAERVKLDRHRALFQSLAYAFDQIPRLAEAMGSPDVAHFDGFLAGLVKRPAPSSTAPPEVADDYLDATAEMVKARREQRRVVKHRYNVQSALWDRLRERANGIESFAAFDAMDSAKERNAAQWIDEGHTSLMVLTPMPNDEASADEVTCFDATVSYPVKGGTYPLRSRAADDPRLVRRAASETSQTHIGDDRIEIVLPRNWSHRRVSDLVIDVESRLPDAVEQVAKTASQLPAPTIERADLNPAPAWREPANGVGSLRIQAMFEAMSAGDDRATELALRRLDEDDRAWLVSRDDQGHVRTFWRRVVYLAPSLRSTIMRRFGDTGAECAMDALAQEAERVG